MTSFLDKDTVLVYVGDTLKEFMTAQAYASLHQMNADQIRNILRKNNEMKNEDKTIRPGVSFR